MVSFSESLDDTIVFLLSKLEAVGCTNVEERMNQPRNQDLGNYEPMFKFNNSNKPERKNFLANRH